MSNQVRTFFTACGAAPWSVFRGRSDRGVTALEYVGIAIVAAVVVGAIFTVVNNADIQAVMQNAVNNILSAG